MFKIIEDYPNYKVNEYGVVLNRQDKQLRYSISAGYYRVTLSKKGNAKIFLAHRLVAIHFLDNPLNYPHVNHLDGDKSNNHVSNLQWCTPSMNNLHAYKTGLNSNVGENNPPSKITEQQAREIKYTDWGNLTLKEIGIRYGLCESAVCAIRKGRNWKHI